MPKSNPKPRSVHSEEYKILVDLLREERKQLGLTQRALSDKLGQHHTFVNLVEGNRREINVIELRQYCRALRISFPDFVKRLDEKLTEWQKKQKRSEGEEVARKGDVDSAS